MKKLSNLIVLTVVAFCATTLMACSDDHEVKGFDWSNAPFAVSAEQLTFTNEGGSAELYVQSSKAVSLTGNSWLTVEERPSESNKMHVYTLTAPAFNEANDRTETLTVSDGTEQKSVVVTQIAADHLIVGTTHTNRVPKTASQLTVEVACNGNYQVSTDVDWIVELQSRANMQTTHRTFNIAANVGMERTGRIIFTLNNLSDTLVVIQETGISGGTITANARDIAKLMYPGWNLGNTMEGGNSAHLFNNNGGLGAETYWQSTRTTKEIIDFVQSQGFRSVRIPASWAMGHITDASEMTIDADWLNRVKEIVDYCIADGLYVVINDHWDGGWIESDFSDTSEGAVADKESRLRKLWAQIAAYFKDYDEHLLFAALNEPNAGNRTQAAVLTRYEQAFLDVVRASGGNNDKRTLIVQGPQTNIDQTTSIYTLPNDPAGDGRLMVEVHFYDPFGFTHCHYGGGNGEDSSKPGDWNYPLYYWGSANHGPDHNPTWGEESYVASQMQKMKTNFVDKGIPVYVGEFGANWRSMGAYGDQDKHDASVRAYFKTVTQECVKNGLVPVVWDINVASQGGLDGIMTVINRSSRTVFCTVAMDGITEGVGAAQWPY